MPCTSSAQPLSAFTPKRPNEPPTACSAVPGSSLPFLVLTTSAPPSVFMPKIGFDPGRMSMLDIAFIGIRSQFTTDPNGSFMRMPSKYTDRPTGAPSSDEAWKPR